MENTFELVTFMLNRIKNRNLVIAHNNPIEKTSGYFRNAFLTGPVASLAIEGLQKNMNCIDERFDSLVALPAEWMKNCTHSKNNIIRYEHDLIPDFIQKVPCHDAEWLIISNARYVTDFDYKWLYHILMNLNAPIVAVNVSQQLTAFQEIIKFTSDGNIAGFRRLYSDIAEKSHLNSDWPHLLFIKNDILHNLLDKNNLNLCFDKLISNALDASLNIQCVRVGGKVLDLDTENEFLIFLNKLINLYNIDSNDGIFQKPDLHPDARVFGNVLFGNNVKIDHGAYIIGPGVIGDNVSIEHNALIKSSLIASDITIPHDYHLCNRALLVPKENVAGYDENMKLKDSQGVFLRKYLYNSGANKPLFRVWPRFSYAGCFKRVFDIIVALIVLFLFAPILLIVSLVIKFTSKGSIFFGHKRQGLHGKEFNCFKFRSMKVGADAIQSKLRAINQVDGPQFKMEDDPRVTTVGKFLRDTYLDEIPQFINVLFGHMSLVGPRPSPITENTLCPPWRDARLSVRPGITGLWQLFRTRQEGQDFQEWIYYDTKYVKNLSFSLDFWVCCRTAKKLIMSFVSQF